MRLSIITINLNNTEGLARTLASVRAQDFRAFEHVVIDGGSRDGSVDVIRKFEDGIAHWTSEPDAGIYNAMNKGIAAANGEYLLFLNSGDCLASDDVLSSFAEAMGGNPGIDILYGDTIRSLPGGGAEKRQAPESLSVYSFYTFMVCHQSMLYKRALFDELGGYDESFRIAGDIEFNVRCLKAGKKSRHLGVIVQKYEGGGVSTTDTAGAVAERARIWDAHLGPGIHEDYRRMACLDAECRRLKRAEDWIEGAKRKPLWYNVAIVCKWRWDRLTGRIPPRRDT